AVPMRFRSAAAVFRGIYEPVTGLVSINRGLEGSDRTITIAHELGHALGLPHVPASERASVMNPGNLTVLPTAEDVAALQQRWGCPL
ncbi:MAG TPA: M66 family metalloprotease, partial [Archangium sp.]